MKKLIIAALAALTLSPAVASADVEIGNDICRVTGVGTNGVYVIGNDDVDCIRSVMGNRDWILTRLQTQIHYWNKAVEPFEYDYSVGDNGAYWNDVLGVRGRIEYLRESNDTLSDAFNARYAIIADLCDTLEENNAEMSSDQQQTCREYY